MADLVLDIQPQFSKCLIVSIRTEDRVVAKALCPTLFSCYLAIDDTLELMNQLDAGATTGTDILLFY